MLLRIRTLSSLVAFVITTIAAGDVAAQAAMLSRPIQYHNPHWSPDGRQLLFESTLRGASGIYVVNVDGSGLRLLTSDSTESMQARWSPDGRRIVFSSGRRGQRDIHVANANGGQLSRLTNDGPGERFFSSFSSDGQWIAYQVTPVIGEVRSEVYVMRSDGSALRRVSDSTLSAEGPEWIPGTLQIAFRQVRYPKRRWAEMMPGESDRASAAARQVIVNVNGSSRDAGSGATAPNGTKVFEDSSGAEGARASRDGRSFAYMKVVNGWSGIYVYDRASRVERLVTGGAGAGPLGYLRTATLSATTDTLDTYTSARTSGTPLRRSSTYYVRSVSRVGGGRWELTDAWRDSTGAVTTTQLSRMTRGALAIERSTVRSRADSASLLVLPDRITGWVVPEGQPPRLLDVPSATPLFARAIVVTAIAAAKPAPGSLFLAPFHSLYGATPISEAVDSIRVVRRDTLRAEQGRIAVLVLLHSDGQESWVEEANGRTVLVRGNAGPTRWWWHIRRGVTVPNVP